MNNSVELINTAMTLVESGEIEPAQILLDSIIYGKNYNNGQPSAFATIHKNIEEIHDRLRRKDLTIEEAKAHLNSCYHWAESIYRESAKDSSIPDKEKINYNQLMELKGRCIIK